MMLYKNVKVIVHSSNNDTNFIDIVTGILQGDTLAPYLFIIYIDYVLWMSIDLMKENGLSLKMVRSKWYPAKTIMDADYLVLLANTPAQAKCLLHSLEQAVRGISLYMNSDKTELMRFKQGGVISTLND